MSKKKKDCRYDKITGKIENIDLKLKEIERLTEMLKSDFEVCPDVAESEKALQEALDSVFIEELLTQKPVGDA